MNKMIDIGTRRELFVDRYLTESMEGVAFKLHTPQLAPPATGGSPCGAYMTVLMDGKRYRAYYRAIDPAYTGEHYDCSPGEMTCMAESDDGADWRFPTLSLPERNGPRQDNAVLHQSPFCHNVAPFLDANPAAAPEARYKALAGAHRGHGANHSNGLHAFGSPDGIRWTPLCDASVITHDDFAFDSQNVSFWSEAESCYVCYFRSWVTPHGRLRTICRTTSPDFVNWTDPVPMNPNLPGEHLYTSQTHPYFRAPHIYVALPTRFVPDRGSSTDILFMSTRAGSDHFERLFTGAFIPPGPDPLRWGNRSNYAACGVVPTGPSEMSIYHGPAGRRYTLRTDGFVSIHADSAGTLTTKPFVFAGSELSLNVATSAAGSVRVELQDEKGRPLPGCSLAEADEIVGDGIAWRVTWGGDGDVSAWAGRSVRLHVVMCEADLYSFCFVTPFYGPADPLMKAYFATLQAADDRPCVPSSDSNLERVFTDELVRTLKPIMEQAREVVRGQSPYEERLAPVAAGYDVASGTRDVLNTFPSLPSAEIERRLDVLEKIVMQFNPVDVFGRGPALYPPLASCWKAFRKLLGKQATLFAAAFIDPRIAQDLNKRWRFQADPQDVGVGKGWMKAEFDVAAWSLLNADSWWQEQGYSDYHGVAWYRRSFDVPVLKAGRRLILYFGAVDGHATIFINGRSLGEHLLPADYTGWDQPFYFDVTEFLESGKSNLIAVRVRKDVSFGGIFRGVKLLDLKGLCNV